MSAAEANLGLLNHEESRVEGWEGPPGACEEEDGGAEVGFIFLSSTFFCRALSSTKIAHFLVLWLLWLLWLDGPVHGAFFFPLIPGYCVMFVDV